MQDIDQPVVDLSPWEQSETLLEDGDPPVWGLDWVVATLDESETLTSMQVVEERSSNPE